MINLKKTQKSEMDFFKNKKVVLYGWHKNRVVQMYQIFKAFNIQPIAYYDTRGVIHNELHLLGIPTISKEKLDKLIFENGNVVLQSIAIEAADINRQKNEIEVLGAEISPFSFGTLSMSFSSLPIFAKFNTSVGYSVCHFYWKFHMKKRDRLSLEAIKKKGFKKPVLLCLPPKTGDHTLIYTFNHLNQDVMQIEYFNLWHNPMKFDKAVYEKSFSENKIILALREPIAQNLSSFYQKVSSGNTLFDWMLGSLEQMRQRERKLFLERFEEQYNKDSFDIQFLWDEFILRYIYPPTNIELNAFIPVSIQKFIPLFVERVVDITKYPFDKEKGYTIIKDGNIEVFVYQLEKLNNLVSEFSEWVGVPFDKLENGNQASDKWIAESYKQAQKEIEITQEYFDKCFNEPYVKHCYSEADIEKFKARWRPHITKEA